MLKKENLRVGVLRGGPSNEYDVSLKTGKTLLDILNEEDYKAVDILITKDGVWHVGGMEVDPVDIGEYVDLVWSGMHGNFGEDGQAQEILERAEVPFVGSNSFSSYLTFHKQKTKDRLNTLGIKSPKGLLLEDLKVEEKDRDNLVHELMRTVLHEIHGGPWVVKPNSGGSSLMTFKANTHEDLNKKFHEMLDGGVESILVEEFIRGKEATCGVIDGFRYEDVYTLPPTEIRKQEDSVWGYAAKYDGTVEEICPGNFTPEERHQLEHLANLLHREFDLEGYSRSDFIISTKGDIYVLEINSLPGLTPTSLFPKSIDAIGSNLNEFVNHMVEHTLKKHISESI
jgi:D-alanine-D-alanine ligase